MCDIDRGPGIMPVYISLCILLIFLLTPPTAADNHTVMVTEFSRSGPVFVANQGQWPENILFRGSTAGLVLWFEADKVTYISERDSGQSPITAAFVNCGPDVAVRGSDTLDANNNFFIGNNPDKWRTDIPGFGEVVYENIYPGIDLKFYGSQNRIEYDFMAAPGADYSQIEIAYEGAEAVYIDQSGRLIVAGVCDSLTHHQPYIYQIDSGHRIKLKGEYIQKSPVSFGFRLTQSADAHLCLVIDPVLSYDAHFNGEYGEAFEGVTIDKEGNVYAVGGTSSADFPHVGGYPGQSCPGMVIAKINADGQIVYSTCFGGSGQDAGNGVAVDKDGNIYLTGTTSSEDYPFVNGYQSSNPGAPLYSAAFVTKLNSTGNAIIYSTYLCGGHGDYGLDIEVDDSGYAYVCGGAFEGFPTVNAYQPNHANGADAFLTILAPAGNALVYSTFLGGWSTDDAKSIDLANSGSIVIGGETHSYDLPVKHAIQSMNGGTDSNVDGFAAKFAPMGDSLIYCTYLGGDKLDRIEGVAADQDGRAYVCGITGSTDFPIKNAFQPEQAGGPYDAFFAKIDENGDSLIYSSFLGGSDLEEANEIDVNCYKEVYLTGLTWSLNFPLVDAFQTSHMGGHYEGFITKINRYGDELIYSSYYGTSQNDNPVDVAVNNSGEAAICGYSYRDATVGYEDAWILKLTDVPENVCGDLGYRPDIEGWSILNSTETMWPESWWRQFDYSDPFYPPIIHNFHSAIFPNWLLFADVYGADQCYEDPNATPLRFKPVAFYKWIDMFRTFRHYGGSCFGFALASMRYFDGFRNLEDDFPGYPNVNSIPVGAESRILVNGCHLCQFERRHIILENYLYETVTPMQTLQQCREMFESKTRDDSWLCMAGGPKQGSHSLIPYRCNQDEVNPDLWYLYVYDSNHPNCDTMRIIIDAVTDTWHYDPLARWDSGLHLFLHAPVSDYEPRPKIIPEEVFGKDGDTLQFFELWFPGTEAARVTSAEGEISFDSLSDNNTLPEGVPMRVIDERYIPPPGFILPHDYYEAELSDLTSDTYTMSVYTYNMGMFCKRYEAQDEDIEKFAIDPDQKKFRQMNAALETRQYTFEAVAIAPDSDVVIGIHNLNISAEDSTVFQLSPESDMILKNYGEPSRYDLRIQLAGADLDTVFYHENIGLPANSGQKIIPDWRPFSDSILILRDFEMDGIYDDTLRLANMELLTYQCGDANADGNLNISDAVYVINYIFIPGSLAPDPEERAETNCDGRVNLADVVYIINYIFLYGHAPCDSDGDGLPDC